MDNSIVSAITSGNPVQVKEDHTLWSQAEYKGFDGNAGKNYVYPRKTEKHQYREYQYKICKEAFFQNTLVVLPDGLGKSFVASVVMYNIYRWYPMGKVIFLSANKSILRAQMEACSNIMNIPKGDCVEITGKNPTTRANMWKKYRVIFGTPRQILLDFREILTIPFVQIKLLVVTEAHKARGINNPYAPIIDILQSHTEYFRILALTSVVGKKITETADIVRNLRISHVEIRQENSPDIAAFVKKSTVKPLEVKLTEQFRLIRREFFYAIDPILRYLTANVRISGNICKAKIVTAKRKFIEASVAEKPTNYLDMVRLFDITIDLYVAFDHLNDYGVLSFLNYLSNEFLKEHTKEYGQLAEYTEKLRTTFAKVVAVSGENNFVVDEELHENIIAGHPKIGTMEKVLIEHFQKNVESRLIIFSNCASTSSLIYHCLLQKCPQMRCVRMVRPQEMSESERNCTRLKFIRGTINTLIVSNIPDEDIMNEVDFIICYDTTVRHLKQYIKNRVSLCSGKKCELLVVVHEGEDYWAQNELWREKFEHTEDINQNPVILSALSNQSPRLVPVEFNPLNLTPIGGGASTKTKAATRSIDDYFKSVPQKRLLNNQVNASVHKIELVPPTPMSSSSMAVESTIAPLRSLPAQMIVKQVEAVKDEKFSNLAHAEKSLENILKRSILVANTQNFLMDLLSRSKTEFGGKQGRFREFLEKNALGNENRIDYFASIVENVTKKMNGSLDVKDDELSQFEETFLDIPDLNTGFIEPIESKVLVNDGDPTRESICDETTLSFFLISSFSELFERDANGNDVFEMRICGKKIDGEGGEDKVVSDGEEEVIPSSQENIRVGRRRATTRCRLVTTKKEPITHAADGQKTAEDSERKSALQVSSISYTDSDDKFDFGTLESIFNGDGITFEHYLMGRKAVTPPKISSPKHEHLNDDFGSPSLLGKKRGKSAQSKYSSNNANDLAKEMNSACTPRAGTSKQSSTEFFTTCHNSSDTQRDEVFNTCHAQNSKDVVQKSKGSRARRRLKSVNEYIHFEASASDDDDDTEVVGNNRLLDSILMVSDEDEQIEQLNQMNDIQAKYLQSVRSPTCARRGAFYIPHPEKYRNFVDVFSQTQIPDVTDYVNDSFVVEDVEDESDSDLTPLEQAEAILKARKRHKTGRGHGTKAKKSRIIAMDDSSEDDESLHGRMG